MLSLAFCAARRLMCFSILLALPFIATQAFAADVVLIEEHWELRVGGPDEARSAPQVTMVMSPTADLENDFFLITLNHWTHPQFAAGGIQAQRWLGEECKAVANGANYSPLAVDEEVISWKQRMSLVDGRLRFEVIEGQSQSWGEFGGNNELLLSHPTSLTKLNSYQPAVSLNQSGIGYAGNRVSSLVLQRIRWITSDGQEHELVAPIDIDSDIDP